MNYPPGQFEPGTVTICNGQPARYLHAVEIDTYATWLATIRRSPVPQMIGTLLTTANTFTASVYLPHYCDSLAIGLLGYGDGYVDLTCSDDAWGVRTIMLEPTTALIDEPEWHWTIDRFATVSDNVSDRAFDTTDQASPHLVTVTVKASTNVQIWSAIFLPMPRSDDTGPLP